MAPHKGKEMKEPSYLKITLFVLFGMTGFFALVLGWCTLVVRWMGPFNVWNYPLSFAPFVLLFVLCAWFADLRAKK
jgi:hypothetical protein